MRDLIRIVEAVGLITPQILSDTIRQIAAEYISTHRAPNEWQINNGLCNELAEYVVEKLGGPTASFDVLEAYNLSVNNDTNPTWDLKLLRRHWPKCHPTHGLTWRDVHPDDMQHFWIMFNGRHYDCEAPDGVENFFELPIFDRLMADIAKEKANKLQKKR